MLRSVNEDLPKSEKMIRVGKREAILSGIADANPELFPPESKLYNYLELKHHKKQHVEIIQNDVVCATSLAEANQHIKELLIYKSFFKRLIYSIKKLIKKGDKAVRS